MAGGVVVLKMTSVHIGGLIHLWFILVSVEGWKYHWRNNESMSWNETRMWCQKHYTDIVMVHNENVTRFLEDNVEKKGASPYYWIGIQKINGTWTWVANGQIMEYQNWAANEPNNKTNENCVELYINKDKNGKWNDDNCQRTKHPLCQKAHCSNDTCTVREDCKEQVNSFTCVCKPGFSGPKCETVVSCDALSAPAHGRMNCSGLFGNYSLNSNCTFSCASGYKLNGTAELKCNSSGAWNAPPPSCAAQCPEDCKEQVNNFTHVFKLDFSEPKRETAECFPIFLFGGGLMNCTEGHDGNRSACRVQCPPGHLLLGFAEFTCRADGTWESSFPLMCASYVHFLFALLASVVISVFCGCLFCCSNCIRSKNAVRLRTQQETVNPAYEAEHTPLEGPLCSA